MQGWLKRPAQSDDREQALLWLLSLRSSRIDGLELNEQPVFRTLDGESSRLANRRLPGQF